MNRVFSISVLALLVFALISCEKDPISQDPDDIINSGIDYNRFKGKEMMIITTGKFVPELIPFIEFKKSAGFHIVMDTLSAKSGVDAIKTAIRMKYFSSGLHFIILVGDCEEVPSISYDGGLSDPSYTLLEGDDLIGDALISRISVKNNTELKNIINKLIFYQKKQFRKTAWIRNAIVVGTYHFNGVEHTSGIVNAMKGQPAYFDSVVQILETEPGPHDKLMTSIESWGANMIVYNSHGYPGGFSSIQFSTNDLEKLKTYGNSFPFIHGAACSTGEFDWIEGDCMAEAVLKTGTYEQPAGVIGMVGFSRSTDPGPAMLTQRIAFKELYYNDNITNIGELCYFSNLLAFFEFNGSQAECLFKHWTLFGDCSTPILKNKE